MDAHAVADAEGATSTVASASSSAHSASANSSLESSLRSWHSSSCSPLLLDLRSHDSFRTRRLRPSVCVPWHTLERAWFTLPAYGVPFAVILPSEEEARQQEAIRDQLAAADAQKGSSDASRSSSLPPPAAEREEADGSQPQTTAVAAAGVLGVKARTRAEGGAPPPSPASPLFRYSSAAMLSLLAFYGWRVPETWAWQDSEELWTAAARAGVPVDDASAPIARSLLFSPSPCLQKHFTHVHKQLCAQREAAGASTGDESSLTSKQPRYSDATHASSTSAPYSSAAASSAAPLHCLDVACGSGRDMCWLLWEVERMGAASDATFPNAAWQVSGIDSSAGALARATQLAEQLGFGDRVRVQRARINQSNGQWHISGAVADSLSVTESSAVSTAAATADSVTAPSRETVDATAVARPMKQSEQRREKRRRKDAARAAAAASSDFSLSSAAAPSCAVLASQQYDLIVMVRFLSRAFFRTDLPRLLKPGGFFLLSTFTESSGESYEQPSNPAFRLGGVQELRDLFGERGLGWTIVCNEIGRAEDGRPVSDFLVRRPLT